MMYSVPPLWCTNMLDMYYHPISLAKGILLRVWPSLWTMLFSVSDVLSPVSLRITVSVWLESGATAVIQVL